MAAPTPSFVWTGTGNFPAGPNPWNGQPLAVPPIQTYMLPGTKPPAEEMNSILAAIANDIQAIDSYLVDMVAGLTYSFNATTSLVVPGNCTWMGCIMCGGGGGGEGGNRAEVGPASGGSFKLFPQGGGAAGAPMVCTFFPVHAGDGLVVTIGPGGAAGTAGGGAGGDGGDSYVSCVSGVFNGQEMARARGGAGCGIGSENWSGGLFVGAGGIVGSYLDSIGAIAPGAIGPSASGGGGLSTGFPFSVGPGYSGGPNRPYLSSVGGVYDVGRFTPRIPQRGGSVYILALAAAISTPANCARFASAGADSPYKLFGASSAFAGGSPGNTGTDVNSSGWYLGGCGGGGGGAGPFGVGGAGGNGGIGDPSNVGNDCNGHPGANAPANSGGGGGGGGGGGQMATLNAPGAAGGAGGSGFAMLFAMGGPP